MSTLAEALFTRTQRNVLQLLYGQPEKSFYTNEILRLTGMGVHTIKRELGRMVSAGILTTKNIGNQKHYQANSACPTYNELVSIVKKTVGVVGVLRDALAPQTGNITIAFVYGSIAKGSERSDSDIDLMVVGSHLAYADLMEALLPAETFLNRKINPALYTAGDFKRKMKQKNHFLTRVTQQEKLFVLGSEDDIEQLK